MNKRLVAAGLLLGLGVFFAAATPASADTYSGYWYLGDQACEIAALGAQAAGHTGAYCWEDPNGCWELWYK